MYKSSIPRIRASRANGARSRPLGASRSRPEFALLHRYETRLHLNDRRALRNSLVVRETSMPNEPSPIFEHPATSPLLLAEPLRLVESSDEVP